MNSGPFNIHHWKWSGGMKKFLFVVGVAFTVTVAVVVGVRMSSDAMAVVVGIVCGMLASVPTSAILVWTLRVRDKQLEAQLGPARQYGQYPPVVVINGQQPNGATGAPGPQPAMLSGGNGQRNFKVIGQETTESSGDRLPPIWSEL
jgi:hypothetical protein